MKKNILVIILLALVSTSVNAQEIYTEVKNIAQKAANDSNASPIIREIGSFKVDALNYMAIKMREIMPDSSADLLDKEALSLHIFVENYKNSLIRSSKEPAIIQKKTIQAYMDASYSNPLFNDTEKEIVLGYFNNANSFTRFSLDTDWRRAVLAAEEAMKQLNLQFPH